MREFIRRARAAVLVVAAFLACGFLAYAPAAQAASVVPAAQAAPAANGPQIAVTAMTLSRSRVEVAGLNIVPVTLTVAARFLRAGDPGSDRLGAVLTKTGGGGSPNDPGGRYVGLDLVSGTPTDGTYRGTVPVSSTLNGTLTLTAVQAGYEDGSTGGFVESVEVSGPSVTVVGTHRPQLTTSTSPAPIPVWARSYAVIGRIVDRDTGAGYPTRVTAYIGLDNLCVEYGPGIALTSAARTGAFRRTLPISTLPWLVCVVVAPGGALNSLVVATSVSKRLLTAVTARPQDTSVPVGRRTAIEGKVALSPQTAPVHLQRLVGRSAWRTVDSASVRVSGRFTLTSEPAAVGATTYRVFFPTYHEFVATTSRTFVIRGRAAT